MSSTPWKVVLLLSVLASTLAAAPTHRSAIASERFVIGNDERPWEAWGTLDGIDYAARSGWIQPRRTSRETNILNELYQAGRLFPSEKPADPNYKPGDGRLWTPNAAFQENKKMLMIADGLRDSLSFDYFNRLASNNGVSIFVDLGAPFPVDEIAFYPLLTGAHRDLYIKGYELFANDGSPELIDERGRPVFHLLDAEPVNTNVVVRNSNFTPQYMRHIKLRVTSPQAFELDQLEVRGEGYIRRATFTSKIIDLRDIANLGRLYWSAVEEPPGVGARVRVQTRVGRDRTTRIYHQINELGEEEPLTGSTDDENRMVWEDLPDAAKGSVVDDTDNWSLWSAAYDSSGHMVVAEGPRQFVQLRVIMESDEARARALVDSIAFEFSQPTMGRQLLGEITPRVDVDLGQRRTFTYKVEPIIGQDDTGFDTIQIRVPSKAPVQEVRINERSIPQERYQTVQEEGWLKIRLLDSGDRITSDHDTLFVQFDTTVLAYGTVFSGVVSASWEEDLLGQYIEEQEVGDLSVQGSEASLGQVLGSARVSPDPFTPNGDGINDEVSISFNIFQVIGAAPLWVNLYDLSGSQIRTFFVGTVQSGSYTVSWNGKNRDGELVPPGVYFYRILLKGDAREFHAVGTITVIY